MASDVGRKPGEFIVLKLRDGSVGRWRVWSPSHLTTGVVDAAQRSNETRAENSSLDWQSRRQQHS